jgi:hypothetical protein
MYVATSEHGILRKINFQICWDGGRVNFMEPKESLGGKALHVTAGAPVICCDLHRETPRMHTQPHRHKRPLPDHTKHEHMPKLVSHVESLKGLTPMCATCQLACNREFDLSARHEFEQVFIIGKWWSSVNRRR